MQLVIHLLLGFRELRDAAHYQDDPLVQRVLGLKHLPDVSTISRMLKEADQAILFKPPPNVKEEYPELPATYNYDELKTVLEKMLSQ